MPTSIQPYYIIGQQDKDQGENIESGSHNEASHIQGWSEGDWFRNVCVHL